MCTLTSGPEILAEDTIIFKVITFEDGKRVSEFSPDQRGDMGRSEWLDNYGQVLEYPVGAIVVSPSGPGIMGYLEDVIPTGLFPEEKSVIQLRVKAGTWIYRGEHHRGYDTRKVICAQEVEVLT